LAVPKQTLPYTREEGGYDTPGIVPSAPIAMDSSIGTTNKVI